MRKWVLCIVLMYFMKHALRHGLNAKIHAPCVDEPTPTRMTTNKRSKTQSHMTPIIYFWRPSGPHGWLSNWSPHEIYENGVQFKTIEHYLMYHKAMAMGDDETAHLILVASTPNIAKSLGRRVANFDEKVWIDNRESIIRNGLQLKIARHSLLRNQLIETCGSMIAEASPSDAIWGIGCHENDKRASIPAQWPGMNLLGRAWMWVREMEIHT